MEYNLFSNEQIEYMYSDKGFLEFVNQYFSTYTTTLQNIDYSLDSSSWSDSDTDIFLRILLANLENLHQYISELERSMTFSYIRTEKNFLGEIKGKLNVNKYYQNKAKIMSPKEYPCSIKEKSALAPENVYVIFIIEYVLRTLNKLKKYLKSTYSNKSKYSEMILLEDHFRAFSSFSYKRYFKECEPLIRSYRRMYGDKFPLMQYNLIINRMKKGKIRNEHSYKRIFDWFSMFEKGSVFFIGESTIEILRYSDEFSNKLFELWCLYSIKETFVNEFDSKLAVQKSVMNTDDNCIFTLDVAAGGQLEIYYQKGSTLYWNKDNEVQWEYVNAETSKPLRGIPDISVLYRTDKSALVMVDIKNRNRNGGTNSEEIYKMIGYFANFSNAYENMYSKDVKKHAALLFRNDFIPFSEILNNEEGYVLQTYSVTPSENDLLNKNQFKELCKFILDVQGINGTTSEIIGNYSKIVRNITTESSDDDPEKIIYDISEKNHSIISRMFTFGELAEELPKMKRSLENNHFPHIWDRIDEITKDILGMAECLNNGITNSSNADYAPICLEYCRALEVQMNKQLFNPFRRLHNINQLCNHNRFYEKLKEERDLTLGECIYMLDKCTHRNYPTTELKNFINENVKQSDKLLGSVISDMRNINVDIRRKSAHTTVMNYDEMEETRQRILGIGNTNIFYVLLDNR